MLSKWAQFEPGTNFLAWCRAIARLEVFRFRRSRHHRVLLLGDDVVGLLADQMEEQPSDFELRRDALTECIGKLRSQDQELIRRRYTTGVNGDNVAQQLGRPANSVYQSLGRVRRVLLECIRRGLAAGGGSASRGVQVRRGAGAGTAAYRPPHSCLLYTSDAADE